VFAFRCFSPTLDIPSAPRESGTMGTVQPVDSYRRLKLLLIAALLLVSLALGIGVYYRIAGDGRLEEVIAELDRTDPNWKWADLQRTRPTIPDAENAALRVLAAKAKIPTGLGADFLVPESSEHQIEPGLLVRLRAAMARAKPALDEAVPIAEMPLGRFPMSTDFVTWMNRDLQYLQSTRSVVNLLLQDAALHAQEERPREALRNARAAFNVGQAIGDEPGLISLLVRLACTNVAVTNMERILAQTQPGDLDLQSAQRLVERELAGLAFLQAMRGERAYQHEMFQTLKDPMEISKLSGRPPGWFDEFELWVSRGSLRNGQARSLEHLTALIKAAELPTHERREEFSRLERAVMQETQAGSSNPGTMLFLLAAPAYGKCTDAFHRNQALLSSAAAALAAERYRLKHGRWPETLDALVPEFLTRVPDDPYATGRRLRIAKLPDGIAIYSVGTDLNDDGGKIVRPAVPGPGIDIGFRLWNPEKRRQPALPVPTSPDNP
jgi:hypothetical protein